MNNLYFEILAFFYILKDPSLIKNFNKRFFTEPTIVSIFDYAQDFVNQYKEEPTPEQLYELIKVSGKEEIGLDSIKTLWQNQTGLSKYSDDWLKTNISAWGKFRSFYTGLESTIAYVKQLPTNIAYTDSEMYINRASNIFNNGASFSVNTSDGHDFFDLENHIIKEEDTHSTGYKFMDLCLKGGFMKKGLYIIMGAPKVGKSQWLCNLAANSVKMGYNTIYITLEMSYQKVSNRIGSNLFNINIDDYQNVLKDKNKMKQAAQSFHNGLMIPAGKFYLEEFPTSTATASDIENFVLKKEAELSKLYNCEFKFANVFIDYVNIMRDQRGNSGDNTYIKIKNICEDVRAVGQRNQWAMVSVTQLNGDGYESTNLSMANVSESKGLIATVDALFGIIQTAMMRASNVYYLQACALRDSPHNGDKKKFIWDPFHLRITEDTTEDIIPDTVEIPAIYRSATANEIDKVNKKKLQQTVPTTQPQFSDNALAQVNVDAGIKNTDDLFAI
jgi:hypothetical protein